MLVHPAPVKKLVVIVIVMLAGFGAWWLRRPTSATPPPELVLKMPPPKPTAVAVAPSLPTVAKPQSATQTPATTPAGAVPPRPADAPTMADLMLGGNRLFDARPGLQVTYPEGWGVRDVA